MTQWLSANLGTILIALGTIISAAGTLTNK